MNIDPHFFFQRMAWFYFYMILKNIKLLKIQNNSIISNNFKRFRKLAHVTRNTINTYGFKLQYKRRSQ